MIKSFLYSFESSDKDEMKRVNNQINKDMEGMSMESHKMTSSGTGSGGGGVSRTGENYTVISIIARF